MMKNMMKTACALAVLAASANVMAESTDLLIKGTITPSACNPVLLAGGVIDYGSIHPSSLKADDFTNLPIKETSLTITCDAATKVGFTIINNRKGTVPGRPSLQDFSYPTTGAKLFNNATVAAMGLGMADDKAIGAWAIRPTQAMIDGVVGERLVSSNTGNSWGKYAYASIPSAKNYIMAISKTGEIIPAAATVFKYDLEVESYLNKTSELDIKKPISLDGSATFELVYL